MSLCIGSASGRTKNYPERGRGLGHVTLPIFGSTVGYPSDSLASCLHTYYTFICKFLFNYLQFGRSYAILNETTKRIFDISLEINLQVCLLSKWRHCWRHVISNMFVDIIKAADLWWLATNNDQQSYQRLSQTSEWHERVRFGLCSTVSWIPQNDVHRRHYQFSAEDWRLNFLSGLTAVLPHERLTVLTTMWPHITVTCPCSPRTLCHVKSIRYHHHHHHQNTPTNNLKINVAKWRRYWWYQTAAAWVHVLYIKRYCHLMSNILQHRIEKQSSRSRSTKLDFSPNRSSLISQTTNFRIYQSIQ